MVKQKTPQSLHEAVRSGNIKVVKAMLTTEADINSHSSEKDKSTLHIAVEENNIKMVKLLLSKGVEVDLKDSEGWTALHYALVRGQLKVADLLIEAGSNINSQDKAGYTALMMIQLKKKERKSAIDDVKLIKELLDRGADVNIKASNGCTASILAVFSGNFKVFKCIIEAGADVNYRSNKTKTALLHVVVRKNSPEMVKALIAQKVDLNIRNFDGFTALYVAIKINNFAAAELLLEAGIDVDSSEPSTGWTALHLTASSKNNVSLVKKILLHNAKVDLRDLKGMTALVYALIRGTLAVADVLIDAGGDINNQDNHGFTALNLICQPVYRKLITNAVHLAEELVSRRADVNIPNSKGHTPLHSAVMNNDLDMAKYLIGARADINRQNNQGYTALHYAAQLKSVEMVKYLLSENPFLNTTNNKGETALHIAIRYNHFEIADLLIKHGINVNCKTQQGLTALHMLSTITASNKVSLVQKLLSEGAKYDIKDSKGFTALAHALFVGDLEMADILIKAGGNINSQDNSGFTVFSAICVPNFRRDIKDGVKLATELFKRGADVKICNFRGTSPLHFAIVQSELELAKYFIGIGADVNCRDENGNSPLHLAACNGDVTFVNLLLTRGAKINEKNNAGNTALHIASMKKQFGVVDLLRSRGADQSIKNKLGKTA